MPASVKPSPLRLCVAVLLAGLVLALGLLAWMPDLHARLHAAAHEAACLPTTAETDHPAPLPADHADDSACVVTLFAQGLPAPVYPPLPLAPRLLAVQIRAPLPRTPLPGAPDRLHPPALAPPALG